MFELAGKLDDAAGKQLIAALRRDVESGARRVALDMSHIESIDEAGLFQLMQALKLVARVDGEVVIASPSDAAREALAVSALDQLMRVEEGGL